MKRSRFLKIKKSNTYKFLTFGWLTILGYLLFYLYPIIKTFILSLTNETTGTLTTDFVGFSNYVNVLTNDPYFFKSLGNSFILAFGSGALALFLGLITALLLNSKVKGVGVFRVIYFLPFVIPSFACASIFKGLFDPNVGIVNTFLRDIGVENVPGWFQDENLALFSMIIMSVWGFGMQMLIFLAALQNVPRELYEAARVDGCNAWHRFWHITMPAIAPMLYLNIMLTTINGMKTFSTGYLIGGLWGTPNSSTLTIAVLIYRTAFDTIGGYRIGYASAMAWIFSAIIMVVTIIETILSKLYVKES